MEAEQEPWRDPTVWRVVRGEPLWGGQRLRDRPEIDAPPVGVVGLWQLFGLDAAATVATPTHLWGRVEYAGHLGWLVLAERETGA
eukprot:6398068-Alexandrium_andersonii.AAC.1